MRRQRGERFPLTEQERKLCSDTNARTSSLGGKSQEKRRKTRKGRKGKKIRDPDFQEVSELDPRCICEFGH